MTPASWARQSGRLDRVSAQRGDVSASHPYKTQPLYSIACSSSTSVPVRELRVQVLALQLQGEHVIRVVRLGQESTHPPGCSSEELHAAGAYPKYF